MISNLSKPVVKEESLNSLNNLMPLILFAFNKVHFGLFFPKKFFGY